MNIYPIALFAHILGVLALFIGMGIEWVSLLRLRQARIVAQVREYTSLVSVQVTLIVGGAALLLVAGVYLTITRWGWQISWIQIALLTFFLETILGGLIDIPRFRRIAAAARTTQETTATLPETLASRIADPVLWFAVQAHGLTALGVVFLMTIRPDLVGSLITIAFTLVLSVITAQLWRPRLRKNLAAYEKKPYSA